MFVAISSCTIPCAGRCHLCKYYYMKGACFAPLKVMFFCSGTSKDRWYQKAFFSSKNNPNQSTKEMDLAALALTERVGTVGGGVRDTVDTLGATGHVLGGLLALGLDTILDIVVDDRLAGRV